jgi:uncharacterized membrane protein
MNKNRLEAFSDGVFAIVITLLILDVKLPPTTELNIWPAVKSIIPNMLSFTFSFIIVGVYWVAHHSMLHFVKKINRTTLWLNLFLLLSITFIPFPASLLGKFPKAETAIWLYTINLILVNIAGSVFWLYITSSYETSEVKPDSKLRRRIFWVHLSPLFLYLIAAVLSSVSIYLTYSIFALVLAFFILPNPILGKLTS